MIHGELETFPRTNNNPAGHQTKISDLPTLENKACDKTRSKTIVHNNYHHNNTQRSYSKGIEAKESISCLGLVMLS